MGYLTELLERFSDENLAELPREDDLGTAMNFADATKKVWAIREMAMALDAQLPEFLPSSLLPEANGRLSTVASLMQTMRDFTPAADGANTHHQSLLNEVEAQREWFAQTVLPHVRSEEVDLHRLNQSAAGDAEQLRQSAAEADSIMRELRTAAGQRGALKLSGHYAKAAEGHEKSAADYLKASVIFGVLTVVLAVILFFTLEVDLGATSSTQWAELVRSIVSRVFFLGLASVVLTFCLRNYRVNMHLGVTNRQKASALDTYVLFLEASSTDEAKNLITAEIVRAVFDPSDTGFLAEGAERIVLDGQSSGMMSLLLSQAAKQH